jgi:hypothetical protein
VAELADAPDLKTHFSAFSTTSETYQKLPKKSFKPTTGADFSPISEGEAGVKRTKIHRRHIGEHKCPLLARQMTPVAARLYIIGIYKEC